MGKHQYIILHIDGGIGKCIAVTALIKELKQAYWGRSLIIVSGYPEVFFGNPSVFRAINFSAMNFFYEDYFLKADSIYFRTEPYVHFTYIGRTKHLVQAWGDQLGLNVKDITPELFITEKEKIEADIFIKQSGIDVNKLVLFQWIGGIVPEEVGELNNVNAQANLEKRSISKENAEEIVSAIKALGYLPLVIKGKNQPEISAKSMSAPFRVCLALLSKAKTFIGIDSFLQHAGAGIGKRGVVLWAGTDPKVLGYQLHKNFSNQKCVTPHCHRPYSHLQDLENGSPWRCPHGEPCTTFNVEEVMKTLGELLV